MTDLTSINEKIVEKSVENGENLVENELNLEKINLNKQEAINNDNKETIVPENVELDLKTDKNEEKADNIQTKSDDCQQKTDCLDKKNENLENLTEKSNKINSVSQTTSCKQEIATKPDEENVYYLKRIEFQQQTIPIILQNKNGPCPLIAIANCLLLQKIIKIKPTIEMLTDTQVIQYVGDALFQIIAKKLEFSNNEERLNLEENLNDCINLLNKLKFGLDVNIKFNCCKHFEYTRESNIFDLFNINLYHGWLIDPQQTELFPLIANLSYNQLVEKFINLKSNENSDLTQVLLVEDFLDTTASQLTIYGLIELQQTLNEHEVAVFFRNNHFNTLYKHKNQLYLLATDQGFLTRSNVVWESLSNIDGDVYYCDSNFNVYTESQASASSSQQNKNIPHSETNDYLLALSLQNENQPKQHNLTDEQYAQLLQEEEEKRGRQQNQHPANVKRKDQTSETKRKTSDSKKKDNCHLL